MSTNMARTPLAARIRIDPSFSDGYESDHYGGLGGHSLSLAELRSPIDLMARTPTHVRFVGSEPDQLAEIPVVSRLTADKTGGHDANYGGADPSPPKRDSRNEENFTSR